MNPAPDREDVIVQQVLIHAPAERIFTALTNPEELLRWWSSPGKFHPVDVECDPRPGGHWLMRLEGACNPGIPSSVVHGVYREVAPPHRLVYTWIRDEEDQPESLVTWDLEEAHGVTTVRITHSGLVTPAMRTRNSGWPLILNLLTQWTTHPHRPFTVG